MVDYIEDPWQGITVFSSPEITGIPSPASVQDRLERLPAGSGIRVSATPPFVAEEELGLFTTRSLNPSLGGAPYTLLPSSIAPQTADAVITHNKIFQPCQTQQDSEFHREIDSFLEQPSSAVEPKVQILGPQRGSPTELSPNQRKVGEGDRISEDTIPGTKK